MFCSRWNGTSRVEHGYICVSCLLSRSRVSKPKPFSFHLSSVRTVVSAESCSEKKQWALHDSDAAPRSTSKQTDKPRYSVGSNPKNAIPKTTFPGGTEEGLLAKSKRPRGYTEKLEGNNIEVRSFGVLATQLSTTQTNESNEEVPKPVQEQSRKQTPKTSKKRKAKSLKKKKTKLSAKEGATDSQKKESESSKDKTSELSNKETSKPVGKKVSKKSKKVSAPSSKEANNKAGQKSTVAPRYYLSEAPDKDLGEVGGYTTLRNALTRAPESDIQSLAARTLNVEPLDVQGQPRVPGLSYGLERILFNPGVYHLQDPRSKVFNFDPYLQKIMPVSEFDFHALKQYITSSKDESLRAIADSHGKKYVGSSSSMTGVLAHFHFLLSQWRKINTSMVSQGFPDKLRSFTQLQRVPSAIFLRRRDGRDGAYAIDADKEFDSANILSMLGKSMEKLLTLSTDGYERYRRSNSDQIGHEERNAPESFHYCTMGDILMRSQLDAYDARLPGTGMFDLKTRAVVSIRMDADNYQRGTGYQIKNRFGEYESYEREYFDMIRSAFLKYSLQVRMGRMDGIFVAFHNTERIFGFQYISLPEMDSTLHGSWDTKTGDEEFKMSLNLLNNVLDRATAKFPDTSLRLHFETRDSQTPFMYIFAEPVTEDQIAEIQDTNKLAVEEFERNLMGLAKGEKPANGEEGEAEVIQDSEGDTANREWERIHAKVEKEMEHDELLSDASSSRHVASRRPLEDATSTLVDLAKGNPADPESGTEQIMSSWTPGDDEEVGDEEDQEEDEGDEDEDEDGEEEGQEDDDEDEDEDEDQDEDEDEEGNGEEEDESEENEEQKDGQEEKSKAKEQGNVSADGTNSAVEGGSNQMIDTSSTLGSDATVLDTSEPQQPLLEDLLSEDAIAEDTEGHGDKAWLDEVDLEQQRLVPQDGSRSVMAMTLTVRNKVNGEYVARPENLAGSDQWSVEYALSEVVSEARAWSLYNACQLRRKKRFDIIDDDDGDKNYYKRILRELSAKGRKWRDEQDSLEARHGKVVFDPSRSEEASGSSPPR